MKYQQVHPETTAAGTIWRTFACAECGRKIYQIGEDVFTDGTVFLHDLCRSAREAKFKEATKETK